jgi:hypothetical protein
LSVSKLPLQCAVVSPYSVVKQRLKCNTSEVCNCLIQFLLTVVLSIEEHVFVVNRDFLNALYLQVYAAQLHKRLDLPVTL